MDSSQYGHSHARLSDSLEPDSRILYGRFPRRAQAVLIDLVILATLLLVGASLAGAVADPEVARWLTILLLGVLAAYEPLLVSYTRGTVGHHLLNLKVVDGHSGNNLPIGRAVLRYGLKAALGLPSFLVIVLTRKHQALHDIVGRAIVQVRDPARAKPHHYAIELDTGPLGDSVTFKRRVAAVAIYSLLIFSVFSIAAAATVSAECINYDVCSAADDYWLAGLFLAWLASTAVVGVQGFRAKLPGARLQMVQGPLATTAPDGSA